MEELLKKFNIHYDIIAHSESGKTTIQASQALSVSTDKILKSLLFKSKKGKYLGVLIRGDKKVNIKLVENYFKKKLGSNDYKDLSMAKNEDIKKFLEYEIGGVPPTAFYGKCETICDKSILDFEFIIGAAGSDKKCLKINPIDLKKLYIDWEDISF